MNTPPSQPNPTPSDDIYPDTNDTIDTPPHDTQYTDEYTPLPYMDEEAAYPPIADHTPAAPLTALPDSPPAMQSAENLPLPGDISNTIYAYPHDIQEVDEDTPPSYMDEEAAYPPIADHTPAAPLAALPDSPTAMQSTENLPLPGDTLNTISEYPYDIQKAEEDTPPPYIDEEAAYPPIADHTPAAPLTALPDSPPAMQGAENLPLPSHISHTSTDSDPSLHQLRLPPQSLEAESSVLGGLLLDNQAWDRVADLLITSDFYRREHQHIFESISSLINTGKPADVVTVFEAAQHQGLAEEIGGLAYLNQLAQYVPSAANIRRYAEIVRERSILRRLISASDEIATMAFTPQGASVANILDQAEQKIFKIAEEGSRMKEGFQSMDALVVQLVDRVNEMAANPSDITGVPTGFTDLDRMTSGMQAGDLIILAARPSMGKTAFALNIAEHVALHEGLPVAVFSMEMGASQLAVRMVGSIGRIDQSRLKSGKLRDEEWPRLTDAIGCLRNISLHIDETPGLTTSELRASARRLARSCGKLGLIVIDYLQLMNGSGRDNRSTELSEISRGLKMLAKELQCPIIVLSQLNRSVESIHRTDKRPIMSDLRESGAIEQDADVIMFIYRDEYYNKEKSKVPGTAEIIIGKQRNGPTGSVMLAFQKQFTRFENLAYMASDDGYMPN